MGEFVGLFSGSMLVSQGVLRRYTCPKKVVTACTQAETPKKETHLPVLCWFLRGVHDVPSTHATSRSVMQSLCC